MNKILEKQIQKVQNKSKEGNFDINIFIKILNDFYEEVERERKIKDRSLELMSEELSELNNKVKLVAESQIKSIMENVTDGVIFLDKKMQVLFTNSSCLKIFQLNTNRKEESLSKLREIWNNIWKNRNFNPNDPSIHLTQEYVTENDFIFIDVYINSILLFEDKGYIAIIRDHTTQKKEKLILKTTQAQLEAKLQENETELKQLNYSLEQEYTGRRAAEATLEFLAYHDPLTGMFNRTYMKKHIIETLNRIEKNDRYALIYLDLFRFKMINDSLGHHVGDDVLKQISLRISETIQKKGQIFRLGGDEFIIFLNKIKDRLQVARICQQLIKKLGINYSIYGYELHIDINMGISIYPDDGTDYEMLMKTADTAMYAARDKGTNQFRFYTQKMSLDVYEQLIMSNRLKNATERGELELLYQAKYNLKEKRIKGFEALLRWNHPEKGYISPAFFIPLAEQNGSIIKIGEWVFTKVCNQIKEWQDKGWDFSIAVNLSPVQFIRENIHKEIHRIINSTQIEAHLLEIEITESGIMKNTDYAIKTLKALKDIGVTISIDDFGTGYSSLSYLKIFPIHKVKIDKSFINGIPEDTKDKAIIKAIVELGKSLGLYTIAEGIETKEQKEYMEEIGCDEIQGYYISKPIKIENVPSLLAQLNEKDNI